MPIMAPPPQVTPSPHGHDMNAASINCSVSAHLHAPPPPVNPLDVVTAAVQQLYVPTTNGQPSNGVGTGCSFNDTIEKQQEALLQRANSLPPLFSSGRCVDHARKPPYHSAPTPMAPMLPIMNVDQEQYQLMMNQLFPIQTTLMHHNHGVVPSDHHHHGVVHNGNHHHQGYSGLQGVGSLVARY